MEKIEVISGLETGIGETRIEVALSEKGGEQIVSLQLSTWHESLGWQVQKTIPFKAEKLGRMQRALCQVRNSIEDRKNVPGAVAQVVEFCRRGPEASQVNALPQPASNSQYDSDEQVKTATS